MVQSNQEDDGVGLKAHIAAALVGRQRPDASLRREMASVAVAVVAVGLDEGVAVLVARGLHHGLADVLLGMEQDDVELGREQADDRHRRAQAAKKEQSKVVNWVDLCAGVKIF